MHHLSALRTQAATLARMFDAASRDGNDDEMGRIAFQQMALDDRIARIERKLNRAQCRVAKRA